MSGIWDLYEIRSKSRLKNTTRQLEVQITKGRLSVLDDRSIDGSQSVIGCYNPSYEIETEQWSIRTFVLGSLF